MPRTSKEAKSQENREHKVADLEKKVRDLVSNFFTQMIPKKCCNYPKGFTMHLCRRNGKQYRP